MPDTQVHTLDVSFFKRTAENLKVKALSHEDVYTH